MNGAPTGTTALIASRVRTLRSARQWTAQRLADEMNHVGIDWNRGVVSKLETGRRESVTVDELLGLAAALAVAPSALLPGVQWECGTCHGEPPPGFACRTCGTEGHDV